MKIQSANVRAERGIVYWSKRPSGGRSPETWNVTAKHGISSHATCTTTLTWTVAPPTHRDIRVDRLRQQKSRRELIEAGGKEHHLIVERGRSRHQSQSGTPSGSAHCEAESNRQSVGE